MIQLVHVHKKIDKEQILNDLTLTVHKGSIYGLLGSNGAGKTTMLKTLAGILKQDKGTVTIKGENVYENNDIKQSVFFMPDYPTFMPQYTTRQMAKFFQSIYPNWSEERFMMLGNVFELDMDKKIHTYSKGLQRQAAFWLALSTNPSVFILDEPFDGLDPVIRTKVKNLLVQEVAEREMTVIISSHNLREVEDLCDHIGIIHKGTCILEKDIDDLKSDIHKIQVAFPKDIQEDWKTQLKPVYVEQRGSVYMLIVKGEKQKILADIQTFQPILLDILPLTLEEIFIYEMGDLNYAIQNILLS